jgi:hypothetical protein
VGKVEHARRFENHDESHGGKSVEKTDADPVDEELYEEIHVAPFRRIERFFFEIPPGLPL